MPPMRDFDEDRPSISGRKIAANIPPTIPGYEQNRQWLRPIFALYLVGALILALALILDR
jgi:hypothetical protein